MSQDLLLALSKSRRGLCALFPQWDGAGIGGCSRFAFMGGWGQSSEGDLGHYEMFFWAEALGGGTWLVWRLTVGGWTGRLHQ